MPCLLAQCIHPCPVHKLPWSSGTCADGVLLGDARQCSRRSGPSDLEAPRAASGQATNVGAWLLVEYLDLLQTDDEDS